MDMPSNAALNNQANKVKDNVVDATNRTVNDAKDKISQLKGRMETVGSHIDEMASAATKEASELAHTVGGKVSSVTDSLSAEIRKYPVQSAAIAVAIGVVGTLFLKRRA